MNKVMFVLLLWLMPCAHAAVVEEVVQLPVEVVDRFRHTQRQLMTLTVFRDDTRDKAPFLILNHGRAGTAERRAALGRARYNANAVSFVERGFAVFVPTRIGYGVTGGPDVEDSGPCNNKQYAAAFEVAAVQNLAVIDFAKSQPYVDGTRGVLVGQSVGGATTLALAAKNIAGVRAGINFAGGGGGNPDTRPDNPCAPQQLASTYVSYGKTTRVPMLWLYSENDRYWGKALPRDWFERYQAAGARAEFVQLPAHGKDGHAGFTANPGAWWPAVERFLKAQGF